MNRVLQYIPEAAGEEYEFLRSFTQEMSDDELQTFSTIYRSKRKDNTTTMVLALIGFFSIAGLHRFYLGSIGMGLLYLFTGGLCLIGTIIDLINHKALTFEANTNAARESFAMMR